jgi:putative ABC transport system permease protein
MQGYANWKNIFVKYENNQFKEPAIGIVDSNFFQFFSMPLSKGDVATALKEPHTCSIIKATVAKKYFGNRSNGEIIIVINNRHHTSL